MKDRERRAEIEARVEVDCALSSELVGLYVLQAETLVDAVAAILPLQCPPLLRNSSPHTPVASDASPPPLVHLAGLDGAGRSLLSKG